jgi:hypothetical protein
MKTMGLKSEGLGTTQKVQGGKCLSAWRGKRFGLRWIRTALMGRRGRLIALAFTLLMLHLDILPAVASAHLIPASTRAKTASLPPCAPQEPFGNLADSAAALAARAGNATPCARARLAPSVGCERERLWRRGQLGQRQLVPAGAACGLGKRGELHAGVQLPSQSEPALANCAEVDA